MNVVKTSGCNSNLPAPGLGLVTLGTPFINQLFDTILPAKEREEQSGNHQNAKERHGVLIAWTVAARR